MLVNDTFRHTYNSGWVVSLGFVIGAVLPQLSIAAQEAELEEIVVTAERRTEDIQKVAASVSVRNGDDMLAQGKYQLSQILEDVPGITGGEKLTAGSADLPGNDNPAAGLVIRGVPSNAPAGGSITSVSAAAAYYVDDVYNGIGGSYDMARVEILRGPQGTLYGRSATSGVVATHTRNPSLTNYGADVSGEFATAQLHHITAAVDLPIVSDTFGIRVSANRFEQDGYDSAQGTRGINSDARVKMLFKPTDKLTVLFGAAMNDGQFYTGGVSMVMYPVGVYKFTPAGIRKIETTNRQLWTDVNLDLGGIGLQFISSSRRYTGIGGAIVGTTLLQDVETPLDHFYTNEIRVHSQNDSALQWQAGVLQYFNRLSDHNRIYAVVGGALSADTVTNKKTSALGAFGEATYRFRDTWRFTGGLRYDDSEVRNSEVFDPGVGGSIGRIDGDTTGYRAFHDLTYKARIEHDLAPSNMVYVSASTGSSPGDVALANNGTGATRTPIVTTFDSKKNTAYEVGSKNRFFGNRLQINAALYYQDYGGFQTAVNTIPVGQPASFLTVVTPIKTYGGEFEVTARPWKGGTIDYNIGYTHARYHDISPIGQPFFGVNRVRGTVPFQTALSLEQRISLRGDVTLSLHGDVRYLSSYDASRITVVQANLGFQQYQENRAATFGDVSATLSTANDRFTLTGYCRNVGNVRQLTGVFTITSSTPIPPGGTLGAAGEKLTPPRTFGLVAAAHF